MKTLSIRGIDTLLFRDGRPFDTTPGGRAETLLVPPPSTIAGFLRTKLGAHLGGNWDVISNALKLRGPLLALNGKPVFATPADAVVIREKGLETTSVIRLRPWSDLPNGADCDLPGGMLPLRVRREAKPDKSYQFWNWEDMQCWLRDEWDGQKIPCKIEGPQTDIRTHLEVGEEGTAKEGRLFTTKMVAFERYVLRPKGLVKPCNEEWSLLCRIETDIDSTILTSPGPLGGERRIAMVKEAPESEWPLCPLALKVKLSGASCVRMILATPAIFELGWLPNWLNKTTKEGTPPGLQNKLTLKLISAAVPRRQAVSGWDLTAPKGRPKPVRWMAPAGSVYFFEVKDGDPTVLANEGWLAPVSDEEETSQPHHTMSKNRDDGFGLALWGVWNREEDNQ